jgi:hypothetical protein
MVRLTMCTVFGKIGHVFASEKRWWACIVEIGQIPSGKSLHFQTRSYLIMDVLFLDVTVSAGAVIVRCGLIHVHRLPSLLKIPILEIQTNLNSNSLPMPHHLGNKYCSRDLK